MRTRALLWAGVMLSTTVTMLPAARAGEPVVGVDVGVALPLSTFRRTADPGGTINPFAGYRFGGTTVSIMPMVQFGYTAFSQGDDDDDVPVNPIPGNGQGAPGLLNDEFDDDLTDLFQIAGGARFGMHDEHKEVYFQAMGGWYKNLTGALDEDDGGGFSFGGGFNYEFGFLPRGMALGLFIRRDQADIDAASDSDRDLSYLTTGLSLRHRFIPAEPVPVVAAAPPPAPVATPIAKKIVLRGVNFDFDKATLRPDAKPILDEAIRTLQAEPGLKISVEGHTDSKGTDAYNQGLSERRAGTVRDYLAAGGIDRGRLSVVGYGESRPVASNETDDGRAQNRRVELRILE